MSRLVNYLNERKGDYGLGLTAVDIDETVFHTFAMIHVIDKETGKTIRKLNNQEFNSYQLQQGEIFDFKEFKDANVFRKTSKPITPIVNRLKRMIDMLKRNERGSKIIFLTARSDFLDKRPFLQKFKDHGIDMDFKPTVYVERTGNLKTGTVPEKKERVVLKYLKEDNYRRVRMIDDHAQNIVQFMSIADKLPRSIVDNVRNAYNVPEGEPVMEFFGLHVNESGKLRLMDKREVY